MHCVTHQSAGINDLRFRKSPVLSGGRRHGNSENHPATICGYRIDLWHLAIVQISSATVLSCLKPKLNP